MTEHGDSRRIASAGELALEILDVLPEGCQVIGFDFRYLYVNDLGATQMRVSKEALVGRPIMECHPGIQQTPLLASLRRCMAERTPDRLEHAAVHGDEERRYEVRIIPVPRGVCMLSVETPEERVAAAASVGALEELRRHAERSRALFEASRAFAEEVGDPERLLETVARTCSSLVGTFAAITLLSDGDEWMQQATTSHPDAELENAYRAIATASPVRMGEGVVGRVLREDRPLLLAKVDPESIVAQAPEAYKEMARRLDVHSWVGVAMHARGRVTGAISMARDRRGKPYSHADVSFLQDLADRAALALDNARLHASLERRVEQATIRLADANKELEAFSYSVAHDLRAPLRGIDGFSQALLEDNLDHLDEQGKTHLRYVRESAQQMGRLIDGLLLLSRVSRGELRRDRVDLSALARSTLSRLERAEPDRRVELVVQSDLVVEADATLLSIVLDNLVGNAWKFTRKQPHARIELGAVPGDAGPCVYFVRDNGVGFDMAYAHKLFGVFQRLHSAHEFDGTGIGLATVERIIRRHGGRVWAEAAVGEGAAFQFTLEGGR